MIANVGIKQEIDTRPVGRISVEIHKGLYRNHGNELSTTVPILS